MKIKKGDKVIVRTGKDKGKTGTVSTVFPATNRVLVDGINMQTKHQKARGTRKGEVVERPASVHASNVMLVDPKTGKGTRIGISRANGKRVRVAKKSSSEI